MRAQRRSRLARAAAPPPFGEREAGLLKIQGAMMNAIHPPLVVRREGIFTASEPECLSAPKGRNGKALGHRPRTADAPPGAVPFWGVAPGGYIAPRSGLSKGATETTPAGDATKPLPGSFFTLQPRPPNGNHPVPSQKTFVCPLGRSAPSSPVNHPGYARGPLLRWLPSAYKLAIAQYLISDKLSQIHATSRFLHTYSFFRCLQFLHLIFSPRH